MSDNDTLTKEKLAEVLLTKLSMPAKESKDLVELILEQLKSELENCNEVKISGFGKWLVKEKRSRPGRNPHTGEKIQISARKVVTFHPSDKLRSVVNNLPLDGVSND